MVSMLLTAINLLKGSHVDLDDHAHAIVGDRAHSAHVSASGRNLANDEDSRKCKSCHLL